MPIMSRINCGFEKKEGFGIFTFGSDLTKKSEKDLNLILMRAIHGIDRTVLNMRDVVKIDVACMKLLIKAYRTSLRLKKPLIVTGLSKEYQRELFHNKSMLKMTMTQKSGMSDII